MKQPFRRAKELKIKLFIAFGLSLPEEVNKIEGGEYEKEKHGVGVIAHGGGCFWMFAGNDGHQTIGASPCHHEFL
jgi:hypothetical protein